MEKKNIAILFGGNSTEHEVSLQSAKNVIGAIDKEKYEITLIGIDKDGQWYLCDNEDFLVNEHNPKEIKLKHTEISVVLQQGKVEQQLLCFGKTSFTKSIDVVFPILHGACGEDGTVQGLLKLANLAFVGPSLLGSAIGMDKDVTKRLLRDAGIPTAKCLTYKKWEQGKMKFTKVVEELGLPIFVKPANLGSSVGINKVRNEDEFCKAIQEAFAFDSKILLEEFIQGQEIECAVLGNETPDASILGAVIPQQDFYSYDAKYIDDKGANLQIPAQLSSELTYRMQELAKKAFQVLCCEGMARVDFFLTKESAIYINEINTIPGFTAISMYPKLWEYSGIAYKDLIDKLIQLALERYQREEALQKKYF
ncbi:D-alanine--D-alanine ligase [Pelosinus sp. UFO1]|uniref:D-alanine--D-alanine ligase n=1 Tax=Pelosinus sp. UFO1 TaxID=484770 RepID=UPI0004D17304|nr:D-alanine--D-alanine ligase [Pelosinus sp. UFO1]AIF50901.1 D-alanine--D-alanine ligase [Pelosinus sp. UFO1]